MTTTKRTADRARAAGATAGRAAGMGLGACVAGGTALVLGTTARGLASGPVPMQVDVAVEAAVVGVGALVAAWMAACAALAAACLALRLVGATWRTGERALHRFAPAVVRRALTVAVVGGLGAGLASAAYAADAPAPPSTGASVEAAGSTIDLGWVVTSGQDTAAADPRPGDRAAEPPAGTAVPGTPREAAAQAGSGSVPRDAPEPRGRTTTPGGTVPGGAAGGATVPGDGGRAPAADTGPDQTARGDSPRPAGMGADQLTVGEQDAPASAAAAHPLHPAGTTRSRAATGVAATAASPHPSGGPAARAATVVVRRGDSLWRIAARHLPPGADDATIAAAWPAWYAANRDTIGDDPGLLLPGQVLAVPAGVAP
ncbi:LysM peptidoglycan-binding domain-containing protein [Cellulomonas alba]|uniref:LysM peptidoglycan-binding domain-containing protein n=1 Tax=Cellulomonas alba TaxID=3053467 RepID=A0ABT7SCW5_9CELL|nr:LysM peptidoglycan-binding domain-containing protein [Cellulomonas alba]MDM7853981.1 LysM peptidoglycan-binding domain-containing protein [Cellulomonas alba]